MQKSIYLVALLCLAGTVFTADPQQGVSPLNGTWQMNPAKSKYSPGPPDKSVKRTYEVTGDTIEAHSETIDAEGKPAVSNFTANYDGKEYPFSGSGATDTVSIKRIDASTSEFSFKRAGKSAATSLVQVSENGRLLTITQKGTNEKGQPVNMVTVYEKQ
jgi:hypothetical protein